MKPLPTSYLPRPRLFMTMIGVPQKLQALPFFAQPPSALDQTCPRLFMHSVNMTAKVDASRYLTFTDDAQEDQG